MKCDDAEIMFYVIAMLVLGVVVFGGVCVSLTQQNTRLKDRIDNLERYIIKQADPKDLEVIELLRTINNE